MKKTKIAFISDLHLERNEHSPILEELSNVINKLKINLLVIAGDFNDDYRKISIYLDYLKRNTKCAFRFVPGNHDLYCVENKNSKEVYYELSKLEEFLPLNPVLIKDYVIIGDTGWYDYSYKLNETNLEQLSEKSYNGHTTNDKKYFNWDNLSDVKVNDIFLNRIEDQLRMYQDKKIISVTHTVPFKNFIKLRGYMDWDYFSAFFGSEKLGELYKKYGVKSAIFGHTHVRQNEIYEGIECACVPLGHLKEFKTSNLKDEIISAMKIIEI